jgi:hypothetical protein
VGAKIQGKTRQKTTCIMSGHIGNLMSPTTSVLKNKRFAGLSADIEK